jgi:hypothetical protein
MDLRVDLQALGDENRSEEAPSRVEMRLRQEFRRQHSTWKKPRTAQIAAWGLVAAAVLVGAVGLLNWQHARNVELANKQAGSQRPNLQGNNSTVAPGGPELGEVLVASNNSEEFTLLPGSMPGLSDDTTVVHVQMQRAALGALGLTVNEEHAGDWIQVDLLLGDDGQPQAVRLPQSGDSL